jgi:hypothetical protein
VLVDMGVSVSESGGKLFMVSLVLVQHFLF